MSEHLVQIIQKYSLHPNIGKTFEWLEAKKAFKISMDRSEVGKIVIRI